jgi:hypothetical protein
MLDPRIEEMIEEIDHRHELLRVISQGPRITISTGYRAIREARHVLLTACTIAFAGGLVMTQISWMGWIVVAIAIAAGLLVPGRLHAVPLMEFNTDTDSLTIFRSSRRCGRIPSAQIREIRGEYGTRKGNGFSRLIAVLDSGSEITLLSFSGTNDDVAEHACELLGAILSRPAKYMASFGEDVACYDPVTHRGLSA